MRSKKDILSKTSTSKLDKFVESIKDVVDEEFINRFYSTVKFDVKNIRDCDEKSIVDFYIENCKQLLTEIADINNDNFWNELKKRTRLKLVNKYMPKTTFDNNIDIYFNDVKREYILHPMNESEELEFIPENQDIFIKNNLKLVIDCAKRYQGLGLPLEDLIQTGNLGLMTAFQKFDTDRANLQNNILKSIKNFPRENFTYDEASQIIKDNFSYTKLLSATLLKIPKDGFNTKNEFRDWMYANIKKASFSSIAFIWIRATITSTIDKLVNIVHVPKTAIDKGYSLPNIIKLDSINPHTTDNYSDNVINEYYNSDEFIVEDDGVEQVERNNLFKDLLANIFVKMDPINVRIIKKRFGIDCPFEMSIQEIADSEGISINKVKSSINNSLAYITKNINPEDKNTLINMLK